MKNFILCLLLSSFLPILATEGEELAAHLRSELGRLRELSQNLQLHLPKEATPEQRRPMVVEDSISVRDAAITRQAPDSAPSRPLQQADFALEALSLDEIEQPIPSESNRPGRRYRSR